MSGELLSIRDLPAVPGYAAALVVEGEVGEVACWDGASVGAAGHAG